MPSSQQIVGRVLVVDDDPAIRELLTVALEKAGFFVISVANLSAVELALKQRFFDAILLDIFLEGEEAFAILPMLVRDYPYSKVFVMSAQSTVELAINALESGASTFIPKSKTPQGIVSLLLERLSGKENNEQLTDPTEFKNKYGIIGSSLPMARVIRMVDLFKDVDSNILISGESGTGKELIARAIHKTSERASQRFEAINCGAIPANLLESELFGHRKGAFTDAKSDRMGIFEECGSGTLLLDEIGELPLELQVKLLRVLQEGEFNPLGSNKTLKLQARVIAATNRNLEEEVQQGRFREDLYFRLAVLTINMPPLRERRQDIPLLVKHFIEKFSKKFSRKVSLPSKDIETRLISYDWPGNIRELQNAVERGVVLAVSEELQIEHMLPFNKLMAARENETTEKLEKGLQYCNKTLSEAKLQFERQYLKQLLELTHGNISEIARISGRYRADVYRLLAKHEVELEPFRK